MELDSNWPETVLTFWFGELEPSQWFKKSDDMDRRIAQRFGELHRDVAAASGSQLMADARTALAAIIVLDQFSRNMFRGTPAAFASDAKALAVAKDVVARGWDQELSKNERVFVYLPFEHSERLEDQDRSVVLISSLGDDEFTRYAEAHRDVILAFGRYPHRNAILGRRSTPEEEVFLAQPGSGF